MHPTPHVPLLTRGAWIGVSVFINAQEFPGIRIITFLKLRNIIVARSLTVGVRSGSFFGFYGYLAQGEDVEFAGT